MKKRIAQLVDPAQWDGIKPVLQADGTYLVSANPDYQGAGYVEREVVEMPDGEIIEQSDDGWPGPEGDVAYNAHADAQEAIANAGYSAPTLRLQLALALSNARAAGYPPHELNELSEALRAAIIAEYITKALIEDPTRLPVDGDFATSALAHTEGWIRLALGLSA